MGVDQSLLGVPQFDQLEVVKVGTLSISKGVNLSGASTTITHGLGFVPIAQVYWTYLDSSNVSHYSQLPYTGVWSGTGVIAGKVAQFFQVEVTDQTLYVYYGSPQYDAANQNSFYTEAVDYEFKYFLFRSTAQPPTTA